MGPSRWTSILAKDRKSGGLIRRVPFFDGMYGKKIGLEELFLQLYFGNFSLAEVESAVTTKLWGDVGGTALVREVVPGIIKRPDWLAGMADTE